MTEQEYRAIPAINATAIKAGRVSMLHMRHVMTGGERDETAAMAWGTLVHSAVLDSEFFQRVAVWQWRRAGKLYDAFCEENDGKTILSPEQSEALVAIKDAAYQAAGWALSYCECELVHQWTGQNYGAAKCRFDGYSPDVGLVEVKTVSRPSAVDVGRTFLSMGYDLQVGWYNLAARDLSGCDRLPVWLIAIESAAPYSVGVYQVPPLVVEVGARKAVKIAQRYRLCEAAGRYPGPVDGRAELPIPAWYMEQGEAAECFAEESAAGLGL